MARGTEEHTRPRMARLLASSRTRQGTTLPPELQGAAVRRLGALALVAATVALTLGTVAYFQGPSSAGLEPRWRLGFTALDVLLSLGLFSAIAGGRLPAVRALGLGTVYQVAHGFLISVVFYAATLAPGVSIRGWTPVAVWTMVYPLIVPSRPRRVWLSTLATAAMDPLSLWVNLAGGAARPSAPDLALMLLPTGFVCILAPVGARIVYGLTVEVKRAHEMGSYRLLDKLGQGGMGEVWRAEHRMLARQAAIKLIRPTALGAGQGTRAQEMVKRFAREAQATAALRSPHTIAVYDYGVAADGTFHYVMELLEGFSLQTLVERFGPLPPERVVHVLRQACHSLAEAHNAGLVHRDIKPANLFACRLGLDVDFVKVLDFGIVKLQGLQAAGAEALTLDGASTGTPGYMPPEVATGRDAIDGRADIYALGCVAYWLLTGKRVFDSQNVMEMVIDHVRTRPVPPSHRTEQVIPAALEAIVLQCLEKDPAARPGSALELSTELEGLGLETLWTAERAREWWRVHSSPGEAEDLLPSLDLGPTGEETWSQVRRAPEGRG